VINFSWFRIFLDFFRKTIRSEPQQSVENLIESPDREPVMVFGGGGTALPAKMSDTRSQRSDGGPVSRGGKQERTAKEANVIEYQVAARKDDGGAERFYA
jgi:hypothetical protein